MKTAAAHTLYLASSLFLAALVTACSQTPQEQYQEAVAALKEAVAERSEAREQVQEVKAEIAELRENLKEATDELAETRQEVQAANEAIVETVNDQVLFRAIQSALLEQSRFDEAAIAVGVDNRVVTLTGTVPDEETRKAALQVAQSQPGVRRVVGRLERADQGDTPSGDGAGTQQPPSEQSPPEQQPSQQTPSDQGEPAEPQQTPPDHGESTEPPPAPPATEQTSAGQAPAEQTTPAPAGNEQRPSGEASDNSNSDGDTTAQ